MKSPLPEALLSLEADTFILDEQPSHLLRRAHQRAAALFLSDLGVAGSFTPPQFAALAKLHECGTVSQNSLGRMIAMDAATMQGVVGRLVDRQLVHRAPDPHDRRRVRLSLTEAGLDAVTKAYDQASRAERELLAPLNARDRQTLVRLLRRLT